MKRGGNLLRKTGLSQGGPLDRAPGPKLVRCKICRGLLPSDTDDPALVCDCGSDWGDGPKPAGSLKRSGPIVPKPRSARVGAATGIPKPLNDFPPSVRAIVRKRSGGICELAGCSAEATDHHHRRKREVGPQTAVNDTHLCHEDHMRAHSSPDWARSVGLIVRTTEDPAVLPMLTDAGWVLLGEDGSVTPVQIGAVA